MKRDEVDDDMMLADAPRADESTLENIRSRIAELRGLEFEALALADRQKEISAAVQKLKNETLVNLFDSAQINNLGIDAKGNLPPYQIEIKPYYHANIAADWEDERRAKAFAWLRSKKHGDLIKAVYSVQLGMGTEKKQKALVAALKKLKIEYSYEFGVPWNTLTAFVKEQIEQHKKTPPLETLGATRGRVAVVINMQKKGKK